VIVSSKSPLRCLVGPTA